MCEYSFMPIMSTMGIFVLILSVWWSCSVDNHSNRDVIKQELRILLIGKTGVGKSTTGNLLLGRPEFVAKVSGASVTKETKSAHAYRFARSITVFDTPGLFDTNKSNDQVMIEIGQSHALNTPGINIILLVVQIGRFTQEEQKTVEIFLDYFGKRALEFVIVVFTGKKKLEIENLSIESFVEMRIDATSSLKFLLGEVKYRYVTLHALGLPNNNISDFIEQSFQTIGIKDMHLLYPMFLDSFDEDIFQLQILMTKLVDFNRGKTYKYQMFRDAFTALHYRRQLEKENIQRRKDEEIEKRKREEQIIFKQKEKNLKEKIREELAEMKRNNNQYQ